MAEHMIPIVMFIVVGIAVVAYFYWNHRNRADVMTTVQKAIDSGGELKPELLTQLGAAVNPRIRDMRRGIVFLSLGIAEVEGMGLGLAISRAIIEKNKGTIHVETEPGAGTTFVTPPSLSMELKPPRLLG